MNPDVLPALEALKAGAPLPGSAGRMYEVEIAADPADFLDWDAPLSAQSPQVRDALTNKFPHSTSSRRWMAENPDMSVYDFQAGMNPDPRNLSEGAKKAGIPGIKYLDAGSRTAGDGTRNYVVFDDNLVSIIRKYGVAAAAPMLGMTAAELQKQYDAHGRRPSTTLNF
jgi:hypothetical protein